MESGTKRVFRIIFRASILLTAMATVFAASFCVTAALKSDRPVDIIKYIFASEKERLAIREKFAPIETATNDKETAEIPKVETPKLETSKLETTAEPQSEHKIVRTSLKAKLERLKSIEAAVAEKLKNNEHYVPLDEIPRSLRQAIVAVEDSRFYSHKGLDPSGIARATIVNVEAGQIEEGGSTITQQLAKNLFLTQEQSFTRKLEEIMLAINLERHFSKDEILEMYLNTIYFGSNFYGVYEAAMGYFGKEPSELTLAESAMLAGLPQAPSAYSPYVDYMLAKKRQLTVLSAMVRANILTEKEADRARVDTITLLDD